METLFAADIGGTKSELAVFPLAGADGRPLSQKLYINSEYTGIEEIVEQFLAALDRVPRFACLAVAGVIKGDVAVMTNLPWKFDCRRLEKRFGFQQAILINDLTAVCSSLAVLDPADMLTVQAGSGRGGEVRGVVAPGTGLGEGLLVEFAGQLFVRGSEGGHADFAPVDNEQLALLGWMRKKIQPVSYEDLVAGPGLVNLYGFCQEYHRIPESGWIVEAMAGVEDRTPIIVAGAKGDIGGTPCPLCKRAVALFLSILGSEAGNLALKLYADGGIYLGGGILPRLTKQFKFDGFLKNFNAKGRMSGLMKDIPVYLIQRKDAALAGAAHYARQELKERGCDGR